MKNKVKLSKEEVKFVDETKKILANLDENPLPEPVFISAGPKEYDGMFAIPSGVNILFNGELISAVQKFGYDKQQESGWIQYFITSDWLFDKFETPGQLKVTMKIGKKDIVLYEALTKFSNMALEVNANDILILGSMHWEKVKE